MGQLTASDADDHGDAEIELTLSLAKQLGPFGYQWLCSCAVYPQVRFALSLHLGRSLANLVGRQGPDEDECLALFSLPWFRRGWMPVRLREILVGDLQELFREPVRREIARALYSAKLYRGANKSTATIPLINAFERERWRWDASSISPTYKWAGEDVLLRSFMSPLRATVDRRSHSSFVELSKFLSRYKWPLGILLSMWALFGIWVFAG